MAPKQQQEAATQTKADIDETVFGRLSEADLASVTSSMTDEEREAMAPDEDEEADAGAEGAEAAEGADAGAAEGEGAAAEAGEGTEAGEGEAAESAEGAEGAEAGEGAEGAAAEATEPTAEEIAAAAAADAEVDADAAYMADDGPATPDYKMPDKATEQLATLEKLGTDTAAKFDAGDMTAGEFYAKMGEISDAKGKLLSAIDKATTAQETRVAHFIKRTVPSFLSAHPEYDRTKNPVLYRALDGEVRSLQEAAGQKGENYLSPAILRQAHINVSKAFGRTVEQAQAGQQQQQRPGKTKLPSKDGKPDTPRTLARVPADQQDDLAGGKFARLDRLATTDTMAYEETLQKMPAAERDEYLRMG
jgi:hypothetical protein